MGRYFDLYKSDATHFEEVNKIIEYLERHGDLKTRNPKKIEDLWSWFSESYSSRWLPLGGFLLDEFCHWLDDYE